MKMVGSDHQCMYVIYWLPGSNHDPRIIRLVLITTRFILNLSPLSVHTRHSLHSVDSRFKPGIGGDYVSWGS